VDYFGSTHSSVHFTKYDGTRQAWYLGVVWPATGMIVVRYT